MALIEFVFSWRVVVAALVLLALSYAHAYFVRDAHLRGIAAPSGAQFSNLWLLMAARRGQRSRLVHQAHARLGKLVRIQPGHVSIADDAAIAAVYGHGNGFLKS